MKNFVLMKTIAFYVEVEAQNAKQAIEWAEKELHIHVDRHGDAEQVESKWKVYGERDKL